MHLLCAIMVVLCAVSCAASGRSARGPPFTGTVGFGPLIDANGALVGDEVGNLYMICTLYELFVIGRCTCWGHRECVVCTISRSLFTTCSFTIRRQAPCSSHTTFSRLGARHMRDPRSRDLHHHAAEHIAGIKQDRRRRGLLQAAGANEATLPGKLGARLGRHRQHHAERLRSLR